ncbi:MAG: Dabb family protein [Bauldia sp.]
MPIVDARDLFRHAAEAGYRLPFVAPDGIDDAIGLIAAAGRADAPLVLDLIDRFPWEVAASAVESAAGRSAAPVVLHRGGVAGDGDLTHAIRLGCGAITPAGAVVGDVVATAERLGVASLPDELRTGGAADANVEGHFAGSAARGRAAGALAACRQWRPVEHVVMFNPAGLSVDGVREMLEIGTDMLASIPGVRSVRTGRALNESATYSLAWLVLFANERVVAHYRDHPTHIAFADTRFRPFAGDRMTIDFQIT